MLLYGYYIVWINGASTGVVEDTNFNEYKKPVLAKYYDLDDMSADRIVFTIPRYAYTGKVQVINEAGFVCDNTNDLNLKGNVNGASAYYSTIKEIIINNK